MSAVAESLETSLRHNERARDLFKRAESRHLDREELKEYARLAPQYRGRAKAAWEVSRVDEKTVRQTVHEIFALYPFEKYHDLSPEKCVRDVQYVCVYATHAMLQNDARWLDDKFLIWFKTIAQSFEFPAYEPQPGAANPFPDITTHAQSLPQRQQAIYDTYTRLQRHFQAGLTAETWQHFEPYLQQCVGTLSAN